MVTNVLLIILVNLSQLLVASRLVLSNFHLYNLPIDDHDPLSATRSFKLHVYDDSWATLKVCKRQILSVRTEGSVFFALFRKGGPVFPAAIEWFHGRLYGGFLDRPIRVEPYDQVLLISDKSGFELAKTLKALNVLVARQCCPQFDLGLCLEDLLLAYPELKRIRFMFASVVPEEEASSTFCVLSLFDHLTSSSSVSHCVNHSGELSDTLSSSWSYDSRSEGSLPYSSSSRTISSSEYPPLNHPVTVTSDMLAWEMSLVSEWDPLTNEENESSPKPIRSPEQSHRPQRHRACIIS